MTSSTTWKKLGETLLQRTVVFDLCAHQMLFPDGQTKSDFYFIKSRDWANVLPITDRGEAVLVRQFRHGIQEYSLEAPGGIIDEGEKAEPAAVREMEEETGFAARSILPLGAVNPNPALLDNRCHFFLGLGAEKIREPRLDASEDITVCVVPLKDIPEMIQRGEFRHSLFYAVLLLALLKYPDHMRPFWS